MDPVNIAAKFEVHTLTRSWDNRGYFKTLGSPWIRPRCSDRPWECTGQIWSL